MARSPDEDLPPALQGTDATAVGWPSLQGAELTVTLPAVVLKVFAAAIPRAIAIIQRQRIREGQAILARRIARGKPWRITQDETAAAVWTFFRAVQEGVARRNLEMMADALVNSCDEGSFHPDEFRRQSAMLADLSREEIFILAAFIRWRWPEQGDQMEGVRKTSEWNDVVERLLTETKLFKDVNDVTAHTSSLLRTGLVIPWSGLNAFTGFASTPRLDALARLVDFDEALHREETAPE